jgi:UDP-N-acetyl-2-amino-2-deoxyglucuronate dehydrogenase
MRKNFVIIGCGKIGWRHAEHISQVANVKAVCDIVHAKADALAAYYKVTPYYNLEDLLSAKTTVDAISICTPNGLHAVHTIKSLQAGLNVLCEKPLCLSVAEGKQMILAAATAKKKTICSKTEPVQSPGCFFKTTIDRK